MAVLGLAPGVGLAQDEALEDDLLSGFDEPVTIAPSETTSTPGRWNLDGFLRLDSSYNYARKASRPDARDAAAADRGEADFRGLSKLRLTLQLELPVEISERWKAFVSGQAFFDSADTLRERETPDGEALGLYESEVELREAYVQGTLGRRLDLKAGRQIVTWGFADYVRVVDVLNPLDNREPGLVDIEDLRLPVTMTRIDGSFRNFTLSGVAVHELRFNKDPGPGSDFYPGDEPPPPEARPSSSLGNTEYGLSLAAVFRGWDVAFYWADYFDEQAYLATAEDGRPERRHADVTLSGAALRIARGNWLVKTEVGLLRGLRFFRSARQRRRTDVLLGFEYSGLRDATLTFEAVRRHLSDFEPALREPPDLARKTLYQYVAAYRGDFLRQRLHLTAVLSFSGRRAGQGSIGRHSVGYDLIDGLTLTMGALTFDEGNGGDPYLEAVRDNDRLFFEAKYNF